jgi:DNA gyrase/topoisomerase IV subunit A
MINEENRRNRPELTEKEIPDKNESGKVDSKPIKVSDDLDSKEILVFTSFNNVYKVKKIAIRDKFEALQKIEFEHGEKPIYLTGEKNYSGFLIVAFENGKIGKISMSSYQTDYNRKKLKNAFNSESRLIFIELIEHDIDIVTVSSIKKVVLFNTAQINPVESRTTKGVQVMKPKDGSSMIKVKRLEQTKLTEPEYYRKNETLNVVGYYLKQGDEV